MKRLLPLLLALLLLAGCGGGEGEPTPPVEPPAPTPTESAAPTPTPEPDGYYWGVNFSMKDIDTSRLPTKKATALNEASAVKISGVTFFLLGEVPEAEVSLYGFWLAGGDAVLVRRGDTYAYFRQDFSDPAGNAMPELKWADLDGDGEEELGVIYSLGGGTSSSISDLHVYEWDDGWTDAPFLREEYCQALNDSLDVRSGGKTLTVTYGGDSATYTAGPEDDWTPKLYDQYDTMVFFAFDKERISVVFPLRTIQGFRTFATLTADVEYEDGTFTLRHIRLYSTGGV